MYCRFCTRKRATMVRGGWDAISRDDERMIEYIRDHPEIRDVIVSGGDPLTLPVTKLKFFLDNLAAIPHVDVIRIGTRVPVTLPQKLYDHELVDLLADAGKVWIQTHFNHPREITPEAARVCKALLCAGMPVNNHTVLLKGVNDDLETMRQLMRGLLRIKVRPYYLFHCDPVTGAGHFRTSVWKGLEIMEGLRGHLSGLGIPTYVVDSPHGGGKIPLMPNYLVSASDDAVVLRNYEGMLVRYQAEDKPTTVKKTKTRGVSSLLNGTQSLLMPEGSERMARRRRTLTIVKNADDACANGNGNGFHPPKTERVSRPKRPRPQKPRVLPVEQAVAVGS
jgi:lysine 2,3-aminomutase